MFITSSIFAAEPNFHMGDIVKVTQGFYRGCHSGVVIDYLKGYDENTRDQYMIEDLVCNNNKVRQLVILSEDVLLLETVK